MTGSRPTNSGIMPNSIRSSVVTLASSSPSCSVCCSAWVWLPKPIVLRPTRRAMMSSRPTNVPPQMNRMLRRVHLDVLLLGVLAAALRRHVGDGAFEHLQQGLLHAFAGDVAGDRDVLAGLADLVDLVDVDDAALGRFEVEVGGVQQLEQQVLDVFADVAGFGQRGGVADGERHVEDPGQRPGEQRLAAAGRADQQDVGLVDLDVGVGVLAVDQPLVVVVDGDGRGPSWRAPGRSRTASSCSLISRGRGDVGEQRSWARRGAAVPGRGSTGKARCTRRRCRRRRVLRPAGRRRGSSCGRTSNRRSSWRRRCFPSSSVPPPFRFPPPPEPPPVMSLPDGILYPFIPDQRIVAPATHEPVEPSR